MIEKIFIQNRKKQKISVLIDTSNSQKGLAFIMHGLGGFKEQPHIKTFTESFLEEGFTVVRFDTTNTFGESEGNYENATVTNYYEDLEDVIGWASKREWYKEPFWLVGHSLGGISIGLYAEKYPQKVKALAPISTVVSGKLNVENLKKRFPEELTEWEKTGWKIKPSVSKPGLIKKLRWNSHISDTLNYDLLKNVDKLNMPVLLIVGSYDDTTPLEHQQLLFERLSNEKEIHIIKGAPHTFKDENHLKQLKEIFKNWIKKNK
ncbi:hypothetical protein COV17_02570 [Candidatus Woesearchaeota archaeon CG10_big_fil_rev_8_21_14_0_10_36_11]|nr:MAG: hypothetical protein COV17_02570 [Candidatus Woesearchaeota archaeon CG10_big_fil_rev_8_21_14_0_10_36_11]